MASGHVYISIGTHYQDVTLLKLWCQELKEQEGGRVGPVEVIENEH